MRVLQLHSKPPVPKVDGGCLAADAMAQGLIEAGCEIKVVCASTDKHPCDLAALQAAYPGAQCAHISTGLGLLQKAQLALGFGIPILHRFYDKQLEEVIHGALKEFQPDIVLFEGLFMSIYLAGVLAVNPNQVVVLRSHNREHLIWRRLAKTGNPLLRLAYHRVSRNLRKAERRTVKDLSAIVPLSMNEANSWRNDGWNGPLHVAPFGVKPPGPPMPTWPSGPFRMGHLGAMDWAPNAEGIAWFLEHCWGIIHTLHPETTFHIAGRKMPEGLGAGISGVINHGEVPDADAFCMDLHLIVVPLLSGGGTRIKIIEALVRGNAVLATPVAAEGLDLVSGSDCKIADPQDPKDFALAASSMIQDPEGIRELACNGRRKAAIEFDRKAIGASVLQHFEKLTI